MTRGRSEAANTLTTDFCIDALQEAIPRYGKPEIFNTDKGSQFTSAEFTGVLDENGIRISMDGKGCWQAGRISSSSAAGEPSSTRRRT